jgi:membrane peptidoglycan carboxypeptidase
MVSAMKDVVRRGSAVSVGEAFPYPAAGKTGTTNDGTDVWFIGYTSDLVAGVWMGFDKPQKIKKDAVGGLLAAPAWASFMNEVYRRKPAPRDWPMPPGILTRQIDVSTSLLATPACPPNVVGSEFFLPGTDPVSPCDIHNGSTLYPDSSGTSAGYPTGTNPAYPGYPTLPAGRPIDSTRFGVVPKTGVRPTTRPLAIDTSRRARDSAIFALPPRDTSYRLRPRDTVRLPDTLRKRLLDTSKIRPRPPVSPIRPPSEKLH